MVDAFGGGRNNVKPPERGVFPLDHDQECKPMMKKVLSCLKENSNDHFKCRSMSKEYLECRMQHDLMAKEELGNLGFSPENTYIRVNPQQQNPKSKSDGSFIAGTGVKTSGKWGWN
eukprot:gene29421-38515_t